MAREHVYPVCRPGARTYTLPRLSDLTLVDTTAHRKLYHNSDRSIEVIHVTDDNDLRVSFYEGEGNLSREFLFDLKSGDAQALRDDFGAGLSSGSDFDLIFTETLYSMTSSYPKGYELTTGTHVRNDTLSPGDIICIANKIGVTASNTNSFTQFIVSFLENPPKVFSTSRSLFQDVYQGTMDSLEIGDQKWVTLMWSGTRWVLLGSNNWY